jgi:hypothetical protein
MYRATLEPIFAALSATCNLFALKALALYGVQPSFRAVRNRAYDRNSQDHLG